MNVAQQLSNPQYLALPQAIAVSLDGPEAKDGSAMTYNCPTCKYQTAGTKSSGKPKKHIIYWSQLWRFFPGSVFECILCDKVLCHLVMSRLRYLGCHIDKGGSTCACVNTLRLADNLSATDALRACQEGMDFRMQPSISSCVVASHASCLYVME
jgi:hypothetical protein